MKCRVLICTVLFGVLTLGGVNSGPSQQKDELPKKKPADGDELAKLAKTNLDVAEKAFKVWKKRYTIETEPFADYMVYRLSVRWLNAELEALTGKEKKIAAYTAHLKRMTDWKMEYRGEYANGPGAIVVESYRAEAEYWAAKERAGKK